MSGSPNYFSPFRAIFLFGAIFFCMLTPLAGAENDVEYFILPETPPTIERIKRPPLDRPFVRKQNFLKEDDDITLPPALLGLNFDIPRLVSRTIRIGLTYGSFTSAGGYCLYASSEGCRLSFHSFSADGETDRFARELNGAQWEGERSVTPSLRVRARVGADDDRIWTQWHRRVIVSGGADWYAAPALKLNAESVLERGEIPGDDSNTATRISAGSQWQPLEGHMLSLSASRLTNTAFEHDRDMPEAELLYILMLDQDISFGAGGRYQKDALFPEARANWHIGGVANIGVSYRPGIEPLAWSDLYGGERFVVTNSALPFPRSDYYLSETFVYYRGDRDVVELEFHQGSWRDYVYWSPLAGTDALTPGTLPECYVAGGGLLLRHNGKLFAPSFSIDYQADTALPLVPAVEIKMALSWKPAPWTFTAGYGYIDSRAAMLNGSDVLPSAHDVSLEISREIAPGLLLAVAGRNLLGQDIVPQPGFTRKIPLFEMRLTASF